MDEHLGIFLPRKAGNLPIPGAAGWETEHLAFSMWDEPPGSL